MAASPVSKASPTSPSQSKPSVAASKPNRATTSSLEKTTAKRRARHLLRDYYGLSKQPMDLDPASSSDPAKLFTQLYTSASLPELIKRENELREEIKDLDSERQSLVYNHHQDLLDASDTIRTMKTRAESLDLSLESLKASFESISQLSESLAFQVPVKRPDPAAFDPLVHLPPLLNLPQYLRSLQASPHSPSREADLAWGSWEPVLRSWQEAGVDGIKEIEEACRDVLKRNRRPSNTM